MSQRLRPESTHPETQAKVVGIGWTGVIMSGHVTINYIRRPRTPVYLRLPGWKHAAELFLEKGHEGSCGDMQREMGSMLSVLASDTIPTFSLHPSQWLSPCMILSWTATRPT